MRVGKHGSIPGPVREKASQRLRGAGRTFQTLKRGLCSSVEITALLSRKQAAGIIDRLIKFLQSNFDPFFAVERSFGEQECAADATGDAVIPARHGSVDEL
jgi:hypothetical protein